LRPGWNELACPRRSRIRSKNDRAELIPTSFMKNCFVQMHDRFRLHAVRNRESVPSGLGFGVTTPVFPSGGLVLVSPPVRRKYNFGNSANTDKDQGKSLSPDSQGSRAIA